MQVSDKNTHYLKYGKPKNAQRIKDGLCVRCGCKPPTTKVLCQDCLNQHKASRERRQAKYKELQICVTCGVNKATIEYATCLRCRERANEYKAQNKETISVKQKEWNKKNRESVREYSRTRQRLLRREVLKHYGGECVWCGEDFCPCLEIDHINNDGAEHRREVIRGQGSTSFMTWLYRNNYPAGFQILCANCHRMKHFRKI